MDFYAGRGDASMFSEYMELINESFEFKNDESGFIGLLPKLYKPEYDPCAQNYVVRDTDGELKAAVGAYDGVASVCGVTLKSRGIGNVAVIHDARKSGYMKLLMNMSVEDMIADGIDFSALGGRRMRYRYFTYDLASAEYRFKFDKNDLRHYFSAAGNGGDDTARFNFTKPFHNLRGDNALFFYTLKSWRDRIFAATEAATGRFIGYSVGHGGINELMLADENDIDEYILSYMKAQEMDSLRISLPYYRKRLAARLSDYAAETVLANSDNYTILNFKNTITAFLRLAGTEMALADGSVTMLIHGRAGDENLEIAVNDGNVTVEITEKTPEYELSHFDAVGMLFAAVSVKRNTLPAAVQSWLPLPLYTYHADMV